MDVQQWLENTADSALPMLDEHPTIPDFIEVHDDREQSKPTYHRAKARVTSDSSIIKLRPLHPKHARSPKPNDGLHSDPIQISETNESAAGSDHWQSSGSGSQAHHEAPIKTYEKRARHKTRPDRYEHKPNKRKSKDDAREHRKSKPKRRKTHRHKDGGRTEGLVQSFQLKNGPKANRLTLKPHAVIGMFSHGRASAQISGRGSGLPDLVFNEMRFLQRPKEHQDEIRRAQLTEHTSKKDRNKQREEEISAYFAPKNPITPKPIEIVNMIGSERDAGHILSLKEVVDNGQAQIVDPKVPLEHPRAMGRKSTDSHHDARHEESCFTWSASLPHRPEPAFLSQVSDPPLPNFGKQSKGRRAILKATEDQSPVDDARVRGPRKAFGSRLRTQSAREPVRVDTFCFPSDPRDLPQHDTRFVTKMSSQSLPNGRLNQNYHTSDILNVRQNSVLHPNDGNNSDKENLHTGPAASSTPASKSLKRALEIVSNPQPTHQSVNPAESSIREDFVNFANLELSRMLEAHRRALPKQQESDQNQSPSEQQPHNMFPTVRTFDNENFDNQKMTLPERGAGRAALRGSIFHEPLTRSHVPLWQPKAPVHESAFQHNDAEALEQQHRFTRSRTSGRNFHSDLDLTDDLMLFNTPDPPIDPHGLVVSDRRSEVQYLTESLENPLQVDDEFLERNRLDERHFTAGNDVHHQTVDEFAGFWRPHRLY